MSNTDGKRKFPVPTVLEGYAALAHFALRTLAAVRLSKEILNIAPSSTNPDGEAWMTREGQIQWPLELMDYFGPETGRRPRPQLRRGNPADHALAKFISSVIARHIHEIATAVGSEFGQSPFSFLSEVQKSLQFRETTQLSDAIKSLTAIFRISPKDTVVKKISFKDINFSMSSQKIGTQNVAIINNNFSTIVGAMEEWARAMKNGRAFTLPDIPGIRPSDGSAWLKRHASTEEIMQNDSNLSGIIQIVREARGPITNDKYDTNLIVRDILWVRGFMQEFDEHPIADTDFKSLTYERIHGSPIGFYYSTMENVVYEIKRLVVRDAVMMIEGVALFDNASVSKTLNLHLPLFDDGSLNFSMGTLMGATTKQRRTGAWTVIAIRPDMSEEENRLINTRLGIYADAFMEMGRSEYNKAITEAGRYFDSLSIGGVLSSSSIVRSSMGGEIIDLAIEMEMSFRNTFKTMNEHRSNCVRHRDLILSDVCENGDINMKKLEDALLLIIEQQSSFAICPVSTTKHALKPEEAYRIRGSVEKLSRRSAAIFGSYAKYREWCVNQDR